MPPVVYVPCTPGDDGISHLAYRNLDDGRVALLVYTALDRLIELAGDVYWALLDWDALQQAQDLQHYDIHEAAVHRTGRDLREQCQRRRRPTQADRQEPDRGPVRLQGTRKKVSGRRVASASAPRRRASSRRVTSATRPVVAAVDRNRGLLGWSHSVVGMGWGSGVLMRTPFAAAVRAFAEMPGLRPPAGRAAR